MLSRRNFFLGTVAAAVMPVTAVRRTFFMEFPKGSQEGLRHIPFSEGGFPGFAETIVQTLIYSDDESDMPREYSGFEPFYALHESGTIPQEVWDRLART